MTETKHAPLSASGSKKWLNCPGSVNAERDIPNPDNEFSLYGSAAHALAEVCLKQGRDANWFKGSSAVKISEELDFEIWASVKSKDTPYKVIEVDDEMIGGVQTYLDFCRNLEGQQDWVERCVFFGDCVPGNWGTADYIKVHTTNDGEQDHDIRIINVADLKFGKGVRVYAERNSQAMLYGLGVVNDLDFLYDFDDHDIVNVIIVQPRLDHIDQWQITVGDLREWAKLEVQPSAEMAVKDDALRIAGPWCTDGFCRAGKVGCKTLTAFNGKMIHGDFTDVTAMVDKPLRDVATMTNDEIGMILPLLPGFYKWGKHIEAHAYDEVMAGRKVKNYKAVQGKPGNRFFSDEDAVVDWIFKNKLVKNKGDMYNRKVKSPPQMEKAIKAHGKKCDGLEDWWVKPAGKLTIAPISDKRTEVEVTPDTDDFNDIT